MPCTGLFFDQQGAKQLPDLVDEHLLDAVGLLCALEEGVAVLLVQPVAVGSPLALEKDQP